MTAGVPKTGLRAVCDPATGEVRVETFPVHEDDWPEGWSKSKIGGPIRVPKGKEGSALWRQARRETLREHGEALRRERAQYRRKRVIQKLTLELAPVADSFCRRVNEAERGEGPGLGHKEVGKLLRACLRAELSAEQVCQAVNEQLRQRPRTWELTLLPSGRGRWPRFELDKDGGATDAWLDLARLLGHGATLGRLRCCAYEPCNRLFFDRSPRGDRTGCTTKHKHDVASRTYRRRRKGGTQS